MNLKKVFFKKQKAIVKDLFLIFSGSIYLIACVAVGSLNFGLDRFEIDYTDQCVHSSGIACRNLSLENPKSVCSCKILFEVEEDMEATVYAYYHLTNFFQNHRTYVSSYDAKQLIGLPRDRESLKRKCRNQPVEQNLYYAPCGKIANSMFNDTFKLFMQENDKMEHILLKKTDIAWFSDYHKLYKNPENFDYRTHNHTKGLALKPPNWPIQADQLDSKNPENNGYLNEPFRVWMRIASWSSFSKIYGKLEKPLKKGKYILAIDYFYPVISSLSRKKFILLNVSILGERNYFLQIFLALTGLSLIAYGVFLKYVGC